VSLPLLIAATWSFESKDPRDKIYAIMSLAAPLPPEDKITVDYTSPVEDLYTQVAHIFIRGSGRDSMYNRGDGLAGILEPLEGLSYVQDPYYSGQQAKMPELPSWVPDFSNPLTTNRIWRRSFRAAKTLEPEFGPAEGKGNLHVLGAEIDAVEAVEPGWADIDPDDMPADLDIDVESWLGILETMEPRDGESPVQILFRTLTVDKLWEGCDKESRQRSAASFREFIAWELACTIRKAREEKEEATREAEQDTESTDVSDDDSLTDEEEEEESETASDGGSSSGEESGDTENCWTCDGCDEEIGAGDWHCESCEDFDLCWECFRDAKLEHDPKHDFTLYQVSPNEDPSSGEREQAEVSSRLAKVLRPRGALGSSAFGSTESLSLKQKAVIKRISQLRIGRWFGEHGEAPDSDPKLNASKQDEDDRSSMGTSGSSSDNGDLEETNPGAGLKQSILCMLGHQRSLEYAAKKHGGLGFLPTIDEIPAQNNLTGATWEWCKYHGDPSACTMLDDESSVRIHISKVYRKRCLFRTKAGRLGLGPQSVRPGDGVWLVAGSRTPYLLRKKEQDEEGRDRLGFLGEAYVHGVMYGEAAAGMRKEDMKRICME
jgi:hypothetical protein